jgi:ABC-type Fe3+-hydroxamate transport system substrate-binding protein
MLITSIKQIKTTPQTIISLVPSQTELLFNLGLTKQTVGITKFCIYPGEWRTSKVIVGGTKSVKLTTIKKLNPDLIIANREENDKDQIEELAKDYNVLLTDVKTLTEANKMILNIGEITGTKAKAIKITEKITTIFKALKLPKGTVNACYLIWQKPFMTVGGDTFISNMMQYAGFKNMYAHKTRYPEVTEKQLKKDGCNVLLLSSEPYPFSKKHVSDLQEQLPNTKIIMVNGEMFSWYGSKLLEAPEYFKALQKEIAAL